MRLRTDERLLPRTVPACPSCCSGGVSKRHFVAVWCPVPVLADRTFRRPRRQSASYLGGGRTAFADGRRGFLGCGVACAGSRRFIHRQRSATHLPGDGGSMNAALSRRSRRIAGRRRRRLSRCLDLPADPQCLRVAGNLLWRRLRCAVFCRPIARPTLRVSSRPLVGNSPRGPRRDCERKRNCFRGKEEPGCVSERGRLVAVVERLGAASAKTAAAEISQFSETESG